MDTRTGNVVTHEEAQEMLKRGLRRPEELVPLMEKDARAIGHPETPAYKPVKAGALITFNQGIKVRVRSVGKEFMQCEMVGKLKVKKEGIGDLMTIGEVEWKIVSAGKIFMLQRATEAEIKERDDQLERERREEEKAKKEKEKSKK